MGLAGPKNRIKISHDPNNTRWTRDTDSFGHKIMTAQGWQPGQYLGAMDAPHAEMYTAANAAHIRVSLKDDNLGLGAKLGSGVGHGECTGLDAFQNLLGRLNGKDEDELEKEQRSRDDLKRAIYTEKKWGSLRFVSGGFLVGDKIQPLIEGEAARLQKLAGKEEAKTSELVASENAQEERKKSKKRKLEAAESGPDVFAVKVKKSKKQRSNEEEKEKDSIVGNEEIKASTKSSKKSRKQGVEVESSLENDAEELTKREKKEKKDKKERRKDKKTKSNSDDDTKKTSKKSKKDKTRGEKAVEASTSKSSTKESTPAVESSGTATPTILQGRHAVRARNIAQKRLASMDVASLNQIFMIKSQISSPS